MTQDSKSDRGPARTPDGRPAAADLLIVIVTFNVRDIVAACLESLHRFAPRRPHRIVLVDNASSDGTLPTVRERWPDVHVVALAENRGFAAANNVGIREANFDGSWIMLLNSDTVLQEGAVDALVNRAEAVPDVGAAGPRLVDGSGRPELSFGSMPGPLAEARQKRLMTAYARREPWAEAEVRRRTAEEHFPDWVSGACLLVRREDALSVGLLDERYFMYLEDADFCAALRARGRRILFTPAATIVHLRGQARAGARSVVDTGYRRAHLAFYRKHHPFWAPWLWLYLAARRRLNRA
jgi:GT2 family glycosyltransferase